MLVTVKKQILTSVARVLGLAALVLVIALFVPSLLPAAPSINWSPSSLNEEIALGHSKTVAVTFTASDSIKTATIRVAPELQPFVQLTPTQFNNITKGQKITVNVTFAASKVARFGSFDGTVQLIDKNTIAKPLPVTVVFTVVPLPPDPGDAGKTTLAGIDSDGDGVRDDVQRYIALTYPNSQKTRAALTQAAKALQMALAGANDKQGSISNAIERLKAIDCLSYIHGTKTSRSIFNEFRSRLVNTKDRLAAYVTADSQLGGQTFPETHPPDLKYTCAFDPDTMEN